jgi:hypothetical protein
LQIDEVEIILKSKQRKKKKEKVKHEGQAKKPVRWRDTWTSIYILYYRTERLSFIILITLNLRDGLLMVESFAETGSSGHHHSLLCCHNFLPA